MPFNKRIFFIILSFLPFISNGQWVTPYVTGEGLGYSHGTAHSTLYGKVKSDTVVILGFQQFVTTTSGSYEYINDKFHVGDGQHLSSQIMYPYTGVQTSLRPTQAPLKYSSGYLIGHAGYPMLDSVYYLKDDNGILQRIDSAWYYPIYTTQSEDSTDSYLTQDTLDNLVLKDWLTGDTLFSLCGNCISQNYQGAFNSSQWILNQYHNDGSTLYLQYFQPGLNLTYGIDVLKFDLNSGAYLGHLHFKTRRFRISSSQSFKIVAEDSVVLPTQPADPYVSYGRILDGNGQQIGSYSFPSELYMGNVYNTPYFYMDDSVFVVSTTLSDARGASGYKKGSHLRIFELNGNQYSSVKLFSGLNASGGTRGNFIIDKVFDVKNGFIYFNTIAETGTFEQDLLASLPLDLEMESEFFTIGLDDEAERMLFNVDVYPNPATEFFVINTSGSYDKLILTSIDGRNKKVYNFSTGNIYSTIGLNSGLYTIEIYNAGEVIYRSKLLKHP